MSLDLESLVIEFLRPRLTDEEKRCLCTKQSISEHIDEESRDEMKEELFRLIWCRMSAHRIIEALMREVEDEAVEDPSSSEDEDDE
jgi:hypothetical protein